MYNIKFDKLILINFMGYSNFTYMFENQTEEVKYKTTILKALVFALYGENAKNYFCRQLYYNDCAGYIKAREKIAETILSFYVNNKKYIIKRRRYYTRRGMYADDVKYFIERDGLEEHLQKHDMMTKIPQYDLFIASIIPGELVKMTTNKKIEIVERFVNNLDWGTINKEIFSRIGLDNTSFFMKRKKVSFNMIFGEIQRLRKFYSDKLTIYDEKLKEHKKKYVEYLGNKQENSYKKQEHYKYKEQRLLHMMRHYSAKREFYNDIYDKIWSSKELIGIIYIARYSNIIREIKSIDKDVSLQLIIQGDLDSILKRKNIDGNKKFVSNRDILPCFEPFLKLSDIFYHYENLTSKQKMHIDIVLSIVFSKLTGIGIVFLDNRELFTIKNFVVLDEVKILKL